MLVLECTICFDVSVGMYFNLKQFRSTTKGVGDFTEIYTNDHKQVSNETDILHLGHMRYTQPLSKAMWGNSAIG